MKHLLPLISVSDSDNYSTSKRVRHLNDLAKVRTIHLQEHTHTYTRFISRGQGAGGASPPWKLAFPIHVCNNMGVAPLKICCYVVASS